MHSIEDRQLNESERIADSRGPGLRLCATTSHRSESEVGHTVAGSCRRSGVS